MSGFKTFKVLLALLLLVPLAVFAVGTGPAPTGSTSSAGSTSGATMTADDHYNKGLTLSDAKSYSDALAEFQKAVALRSNFAEAYNMIGFTYRMLGKLDLSLRNYEKALSLQPDFPQAHEYLGETYLAANDLLHAMQNYLILKNAGRQEAQELWDKIVSYVGSKAKV
jgi:Tfp pilus assembly protein PilF